MSDTRPSIAELQRISRGMPLGKWELATDEVTLVELLKAGPVLLEIVAAVQVRQSAMTAIEEDRSDTWDAVYAADAAIKSALAKVRP